MNPIPMTPSSIPQKIGPYLFRNLIGTGSTSAVYRVLKDFSDELLCCKVLPRAQFQKKTNLEHFYSELLNLTNCSHPNVVQLVDIQQDSLNIYVIYELCTRGSLEKFIISNGKLTEEQAKTIFVQIIRGLGYLHSLSIAHRDMKSDNVFICEDFSIKIGDFGFSKNTSSLMRTLCGTMAYCSPEVLSKNYYDGKKADIWSCGILLYTIVSGRFPWTSKSQQGMCEQIKSGDIFQPKDISKECWGLIKQMTNIEPNLRPDCEEILKNDWLKNCNLKEPEFLDKKLIDITKVNSLFQNSNNLELKDITHLNSSPSTCTVKLLLQSCSRKSIRRRSSVFTAPIQLFN